MVIHVADGHCLPVAKGVVKGMNEFIFEALAKRDHLRQFCEAEQSSSMSWRQQVMLTSSVGLKLNKAARCSCLV